MFKKITQSALLVVIAMFLLVGCPNAKETTNSTPGKETYVDENYAVHIVTEYILSKKEMADSANAKKWRNGYNQLSSDSSLMKEMLRATNDNNPFRVEIKQFLHLPNKAVASFIGNGKSNSGNVYVINVSYITEDSKQTNITFGSETTFANGQKAFLSSPVAQRAFEKAGISLPQEQINSMLEIK